VKFFLSFFFFKKRVLFKEYLDYEVVSHNLMLLVLRIIEFLALYVIFLANVALDTGVINTTKGLLFIIGLIINSIYMVEMFWEITSIIY